ncbi:nutrient reservoir, putative [Ricinus communis]|uniref:Nutrient reservoir, putative n=1 Tax=Ricinus communis TaxID=3988 RepID=B9SKF4_RICCO|nr:nutrient reservoir, putative [Ricinus communis]
MACSSFLSLSLCLLFLSHSSLAQIEQATSPYSEGNRIIVNSTALALSSLLAGRGIQGSVFPGCPETCQSPSESQSESRGQEQSRRDQHQKVRQIREGDVIALHTGVAQWIYNNGRSPLVLVQIIDTSNPTNQLDQNHRDFFLAGNPQQEVQSQRGERGRQRERRPISMGGARDNSGNVFSGMDERMIAEAFNINTDLARKLRGENDLRGIIETFCKARLRHNIDKPSEADIYNPRAGRVSNVNSHNLPILRFLQLSIQKAVLYKNAIMTPHWNINARSIRYITRGSGRVQIVNENGNSVFDGQTNDKAKINQLAGRVSAIRSMPEEVVANAFQVSVEDARRLKENRQEVTLVSPGTRSTY